MPPASELFSCFAVEVFSISFGVSAALVDDAIAVIGRGVEGIEFERPGAGVDDVVIDPGRDQYRKAGLDRRPGAIQYCFARTFLNAEELVNLVDLGADLASAPYRIPKNDKTTRTMTTSPTM